MEQSKHLVVVIQSSRMLEEAKRQGVCRICGKPIELPVDPTYPQKYNKMVGRTVNDGEITLDHGEEYAHTRCLIHGTPHKSVICGGLK